MPYSPLGTTLDGIGVRRRQTEPIPKDPTTRPFIEHVEELRRRFFLCLLFVLACSGLGYALKDRLLALLIAPLGGTLYYTSPVGGFNLTLQLALFFGLVLSVPLILYQSLRFVFPAVDAATRRKLAVIPVASTLLVLLGVSFAYYFSLPSALHFLGQFSTDQVRSLISTDQYFSFVSAYLVGFAVIFQLPLVMLFVNSFSPLRVRTLLGLERWVVLVSFVLAAVLTPTPDPVNQTIMALPLILLYNVSLLGVWVINRKSR